MFELSPLVTAAGDLVTAWLLLRQAARSIRSIAVLAPIAVAAE